MADSLPSHSGQLWVRVRADVSRQGQLVGCLAIRHQPYIELDLHSDPVWNAEPAVGSVGYSGRMGHDHLVHGRNLATLQMGCRGSSTVFYLGVLGDCFATLDHSDELGKIMILGFFQTTLRRILANGLVDSNLDTITDN